MRLAGNLLALAFVSCLTTHIPSQDVPPERYSLGGLSHMVTTITGGPGWAITTTASAGDVDGDGIGDLLLRRVDKAGAHGDEVFLIYGGSLAIGELDLEGDGFRKTVIRTAASPPLIDLNNRQHSSVSGEQDVNGDGTPDLLVASTYEPSAGGAAILVVLGGPLPREIDGSMIGSKVQGSLITDSSDLIKGFHLGQLALLVNDLNGDGFDEIGITDPGFSLGGPMDAPIATVYVIFGAKELPPVLDLSLLGTGDVPGFRFEASEGHIIRHLSSLGDVDGDGLFELGIGMSPRQGESKSILLFGAPEWPPIVFEDDPQASSRMALAGYGRLAAAGDVDADGLDDVLLDITLPNLSSRGDAHLLYGSERRSLPQSLSPASFLGLNLGTVISSPITNFIFTPGKDVDGDRRPEIFAAFPQDSISYGVAKVNEGGSAFYLRSGLRSAGRLPEKLSTEDVPSGLGLRIEGIVPGDGIGQEAQLFANFFGELGGAVLLAGFRDECERPFRDELKLWLLPVNQLPASGPPRLRFIYPERGPRDGGTEVVLLGTGFTPKLRVSFGAREAKVKELLGAGIAIVEAPRSDAPGPVRIVSQTEVGISQDQPSYLYTAQRNIRIGSSGERSMAVRYRDPGSFRSGGIGTGDFNGDGKADLAMAKLKVGGGEEVIQILFGRGVREDVEIDSLSPNEHAVIRTVQGEGPEAMNLAAGGDLNGDGFDDLVLLILPGLRVNDEWLLIFGRSTFPPETRRLEDLPDTVRFHSQDQNGFLTYGMFFIPDLNGDGLGELVLTALHSGQTSIYVVNGRREWPEREVLLDELAENGLGAHLIIRDVEVGTVAGTAGDFNHDGRPDLFFGGMGSASNGAVMVLYGDPLLFAGRTILVNGGLFGDSAGLFAAGSSESSAGFGFSATFPGAIGLDGQPYLFMKQDDLRSCSLTVAAGGGTLVDSAHLFDAGIPETSRSVLGTLYSGKGLGLPDFSPGDPGTQPGVIRLQGEVPGEGLGLNVIPAGDFDGDGTPDLLLGAPGVGIFYPQVASPSSGACYLIRGGYLDPAKPLVRMSDAGEAVIRFAGEGIYGFGLQLDAGFDWDLDGYGDLLVGGYYGEAYVIFGGPEKEAQFIRGDANEDSNVDLSDGVSILGFLFLGTGEPSCRDAADADDDGDLTITDAIYLLSHLFLGGPAPPAPYPGRGSDPTDSDPFRCRV